MNEDKKIIGYYNPSVYLTFLGSSIAIWGMRQAFLGSTRYAILCLMCAGFIDLFDGVVARKVKRNEAEKTFGVQLDSLADMINFVALPIAIYISIGYQSLPALLLLVFYMLAAIQRLAYFNTHQTEKLTHYRGLPVTYVALIFTWGWLFFHHLASHFIYVGMGLLMGISAVLFILNIPIAKPKMRAYIVFTILAIATAILLIVGA